MEELDLSKNLLQSFEDFQKILLYRRQALLNLNLSQISFQLLSLFKEPSFVIGDLFLEFLWRLSYALYLKSKLLLNLSEEEEVSSEEEERLFDGYEEEKKRVFQYFWGMPLQRILEDKVFLPKVNGWENWISFEEKGDINLLIGIFIEYLERLKKEPSIKLEFSEKTFEDYLGDLRDFIYREKFFTWEEFLEKKGISGLLEMVFYFLALLFLVFYGECGVHQEEEGIIQIFLRD